MFEMNTFDLMAPIWKTAGPYPLSRAYWGYPVGAAMGALTGGGLGYLAGSESGQPEDALAGLATGAGAGALAGLGMRAIGRGVQGAALRGRARAGSLYDFEAGPLGLSGAANPDIPKTFGQAPARFITHPATQFIAGGGPSGMAMGLLGRGTFARQLADRVATGDPEAIRLVQMLQRREPNMRVAIEGLRDMMPKVSSAPLGLDIFWDAFEDELPKLAT